MIMIKEPHNHKEASGSVTIIEEVSQSWSEDISRPGRFPAAPPPPRIFLELDVSLPDVSDQVVSTPVIFGPGRFDPAFID